jgi:DNA-binding GntR family transcriptional regulator
VSTASDRLRPISPRGKLADEITESIRQAILAGSYSEGERLSLASLASELGVSAMPVREALISLAHDGLVQSLPRRGFQATPLNQQDLDDLFELHAHISGVLAGRAAAVISDEQLSGLVAIQSTIDRLAKQRSSGGVAKDLEAANDEFHRRINTLAGGERLRGFLRQTSRYVPRALYGAAPEWLDGTLRDHPKILAALRRRDPKRTRELMEAHIRQGSAIVGRTRLGAPSEPGEQSTHKPGRPRRDAGAENGSAQPVPVSSARKARN